MTVFACLCVIPVLFAYVSALRKSGLRVLVLLAGATCFVCYYATRRLTGTVQRLTLQRGMFGYDINKKGTPAGDVRVPEAAGLAPAAVFLASLSVLQVAHMWLGGEGAKEWAVEHNSALATIGFAVFLGFVDDVLELPWRAKMILPAFAAMPCSCPTPARPPSWSPGRSEGRWSSCSGRAPATSACSTSARCTTRHVPAHDFLHQLHQHPRGDQRAGGGPERRDRGGDGAPERVHDRGDGRARARGGPDARGGDDPGGGDEASARCAPRSAETAPSRGAAAEAAALAQGDVAGASMHDAHIFSLCLTAPFLACTLGLLAHNWYPSKVSSATRTRTSPA